MFNKFNKFINRILAHEGGYSNHPADKGGETNWGITAKTAKANGYAGDMRILSREQAIEIYRKAFWERYRCEELPESLAFQFLDACINHGYGNAARMLQRAVGVADDGVVGNITLAAVARFSEQDLICLFNAERIRFFTKLSTFNTFGRGWMNRVAQNLRFGADDTQEPVVGWVAPDADNPEMAKAA